MTLVSTIDPSLNDTLPKARKLSPRMMVWIAVLTFLIAGMASAGYFLIRWRMSAPEAVVLLKFMLGQSCLYRAPWHKHRASRY